MEEKTIEQLKAEAEGLGIKFNANIGTDKLQEKIEAFYDEQAKESIVQVQEEVEEAPATNKRDLVRQMINKAKAKAFKKRVVTITSNDKRDNDVVTTAYLGFENQYFNLDRYVPLDIPVELEQCLIDIAKATEILHHVDEIVDGRRTGNKVQKMAKKFNVSYEDVK